MILSENMNTFLDKLRSTRVRRPCVRMFCLSFQLFSIVKDITPTLSLIQEKKGGGGGGACHQSSN